MNELLEYVPLVIIGTSALAGLVTFTLPESAERTRVSLTLGAAVLKVVLVAAMLPLVYEQEYPQFSVPMLPGIELVLRVDSLAALYAGLSAVLWLATTVFAVGYFRRTPNRSRFFGFFSLCVTAAVGISFAGNLVTFLVFYELLSLTTYPLVAHFGSSKALKAARLYLFFTLTGGLALLVGTVLLTTAVGPVDFVAGGAPAVAEFAASDPGMATLVIALLLAGLGVKAALVPLHGWLPRAMVAPAPVSALLHAVAVVKAGVFGIVRVIDDLFGVPVSAQLGALSALLVVASVTIVYGSVRALFQDDLKARLAYSTVSQVSYVTFGLAMVGVVATTGGVVHVVHQGLMKITLFFCAGLFAETVGVKKISQMGGLGARMPLTALAFTIGGLGMIGLPPLAGFVSKWQLGLGAIDAGRPELIVVLLVSSVLNAAYFLPVIWSLWWGTPDPEVAARRGSPAHAETGDRESSGKEREGSTVLASTAAPVAATAVASVGRRLEASGWLLFPALATAAAVVLAGLLAGAPYSPLDMAQVISERVYR